MDGDELAAMAQRLDMVTTRWISFTTRLLGHVASGVLVLDDL